jgi:hypothetical protein
MNPVDQYDTRYLCYDYQSSTAWLDLIQHICLVLTYDASSRGSCDEVVATCERMHSRCDDGGLPLPTMIAAMGEGSVSHEEARALASQWGCLFVTLSPVTGRGVCDAIGSLVVIAHGARDQYPTDHHDRFGSEDARSVAYRESIHKRSKAIQALFAE